MDIQIVPPMNIIHTMFKQKLCEYYFIGETIWMTHFLFTRSLAGCSFCQHFGRGGKNDDAGLNKIAETCRASFLEYKKLGPLW